MILSCYLQQCKQCEVVLNYVLFDWEGGPDGKIFGWSWPKVKCFPVRPDLNQSMSIFYHMTVVLFFSQSENASMAAFSSFRARFLAGPSAFFRPYHLARTALGTLFSYGFPTKLRARSYGSYDKMWWITWLYSDKQISVLCNLVSVFKRSFVITWLLTNREHILISSLCGKVLHFYVRISLLKMNLVPVG